MTIKQGYSGGTVRVQFDHSVKRGLFGFSEDSGGYSEGTVGVQ